MTGTADLDTISTLDVQSSVPNLDVDSPRSSTSHNPTKKQVESNLLSRWMELAAFFGSLFQLPILDKTMRKSELSSDEVTASAVVSSTVGNASGLILAIIGHFALRSTYRNGDYHFQLMTNEPSAAEKAQMKRNDVCLYLNNGKIKYFVKRASFDLVPGEIDENEGGTEKSRHGLRLLKRRLARLRPGDTAPALPELCRTAFLDITHDRGHTYSGRPETDPPYRVVKTCSAAGARFGSVLCAFLGVDNPNVKRVLSFILADVFCVVFGVFGFLFYLIRDKVFKIRPGTKPSYARTGLEGWSKYAKTALTFGTAVGQGIGGLIIGIANAASSSAATVSSFSISFWGGVVGLGSFVASLIFVPLINWVSSKFTSDHKGILTSENKNKFRNNYTRSGLTLGAGLGALVGLVIGNWCFGLIMAATIFSGLGAAIGAVALSVYGYRLHRKLHVLPPGKTDKDEDQENSFDYVTRCVASVFGFIGAAVVCFINPAMALLLVPIGTAIASAVGWGLGLLIMKRARSLPGNETEKKSSTLPWTQRIITGANIGSMIGGCLGLAVGFAGFIVAGPASVIFAVSFFGALGAVAGGIIGALYDKNARNLIWQAINPWSQPPALPRQPSRRIRAPGSLLDASYSSTAKVLVREKVSVEEDHLRKPLSKPDDASLLPFLPPPVLRITSSGSDSSHSDGPALFSPSKEKHREPRSIERIDSFNAPALA